MPRAKKDAKPFTMKMDAVVYEQLEQYCADSGQTKTIAIERALTKFIDDYYEQQKLIKKRSR